MANKANGLPGVEPVQLVASARNSSSIYGTSADLEKIRYVTEHFRQLQGLGSAVFGAFWVFYELALRSQWGPRVWLWFVVFGIGLAFSKSDYLEQYYWRRFGWIEQPKKRELESNGYVAALAFVLALIVLEWLGNRLGCPELWFRTIIFFVFVYDPGWSRERFINPRNVYLLPAILGAIFVYGYPMLHPPDSVHTAFWKELTDLVLPVFLIVVGLFDHILLLRLMPKRVLEDDYDG